MGKIEITEPIDTMKQISDVFVVEVAITVTDTQAGETRYVEVED